MKALSLTQPWAMLVVTGAKRVETRSWSTLYRGPLLIHAGKRFSEASAEFAYTEWQVGRVPPERKLVFGGIIGRVVLKNIYRTENIVSTLTSLERLYGDYTPCRWAWELGDPEVFESPIPYKGSLGLFEVDWPAPKIGS